MNPVKFRILLLMSALLFSVTPSVFAEGKISITSIKGGVRVFRDGQWTPVMVQTTLQEGDLLKTQKDAQADISMNGRAGVRMLPLTEMSLKISKRDQMCVELKIGNIIANVEKYEQDSKFEVETPLVILGVRGTQFWGRVQDSSAPLGTTFAVREGIVNIRVKESGEVFILERGRALDIPWDKSEPLEREAYEQEMEALGQAEEIEIENEVNLSKRSEGKD